MSDQNYWRSLRELHNDPQFIEDSTKEFSEDVKSEFDSTKLSGLSRRKFLALMGASAALAGAGCSNYKDKGEIIPYNKKPEEIQIGEPNFYASTCTLCENACGIIIKTREGRPIKVDGNPDNPVNKGKICSKGQASILNLYDPERLGSPLKKSGGVFNKINWNLVDQEVISILSNAGGKEIALISGVITSPTELKVIADFKTKYPTIKHYSYSLFNETNRITAWQQKGGQGLYPLIKWDEAKIVISLEADFLGSEGNVVETAQLFAKGRDVNNIDKFNRLYAFEGTMSVTGMNADYRFRLRPDAIGELVQALSASVGGNSSALNSFAQKYSLNKKELSYLAKDLADNKGKAIVYAGRALPASVHSAVFDLNSLIGADALYRTDTQKTMLHQLSTPQEIKDLVNRLNGGNVYAVVHLDANAVFHFPGELGYKQALMKASSVITLSELENETTEVSNYILPINHCFESWGDAKTRTGFISLQQPVISPLHNTRQKEAVLLAWSSGNAKAYNENLYLTYLKKNWQGGAFVSAAATGSFDSFWNNSLHDGVVLTSGETVNQQTVLTQQAGALQQMQAGTGYVLLLKESYSVGDGRFANNGWLQELPHPVSKVVWDNYASISATTAKELDVESGDLLSIKVNNKTVQIPAFVQPGAADKTIVVELGYGRTRTGVVGTGTGFNLIPLMSGNGLTPFLYQNVSVSKAGGSYELVSTQEHYAFDKGHTKDAHKQRNILKEGTVEEYKKDKKFLTHGKHEEYETIFGDQADKILSKGVKWHMAIDQNKCLGCGDCIVSCYAENNIPVVGKEQVKNSREMQWIRLDRYYSGTFDEPKVSKQVMLCQHCDHAPCENVCPVVATTHSEDGLNQMVYNRCVGTRYCSNNCPYKVRRFNFFNFRSRFADGVQESNVFSLIYNPEVTIRSRGVMEKCTFCVQRIMKAREDATAQNKQVKGVDVKTACQEACVTEAISFGDMNDQQDPINNWRKHDLKYYVLDELNTKPNVTYIAQLRNTHPEDK